MRLVTNELGKLPLFADASRSELAQISKQLTQLSIPAGRVLLREGVPGDDFFVIAEGTVEVSKGGVVVATAGRGDVVGEMALLHQSGRGTRNATVTALTDVVIHVGSRAEFRQIIHVASSVAEKIAATASSRMQEAA
jgi:CRP-like cAMP-binding protein